MIHANRIVTVGEQECIIDRPIVLYRGDREVEIEFTLVGNEFTFSEEGNVIKSVNASHGQLVLNTPSGEHMFSELAECHEGKVVFVVTKEMIDEFIEMGFYSFQIRLYDSAEMKSRVTIPPVMNGFDIRNPIAAEDETNVVDQGIVDYARIFKDQSNEELPTFDWTGAYNKTEWVHHDVITENKLNKIEDALYSINANIKESDVVMLNALDNVKKDADAYVKEHMAEVEANVDEFERNLNTDVQQFKIDTNAAMTAHKNEVSEELESVNSQLAQIEKQSRNEYYLFPSLTNDTQNYNSILSNISGNGGDIIFTEGVYYIDKIGLKSNINIYSKGKVTIISDTLIINHISTTDDILKNITIKDLNFESISNSFSEHAHMIKIVGCENIFIENCKFTGFRGDGIYLGGEEELHNKNIYIKNNYFNGVNRENRNAISVIDGENIFIENNYFEKCTKSSMPGAIDIEPNPNSYHIIKNINIEKNTFKEIGGNTGVICIMLPLSQEKLDSPVIGIKIKNNVIDTTVDSQDGIMIKQVQKENIDVNVQPINIEVEDNIFKNIKGRPFQILGVNGVKVKNNVFEIAFITGLIGYINEGDNCVNIEIANNEFNNIGRDGVGMNIFTVNNLKIINNLFYKIGKLDGTYGVCINFNKGQSENITIDSNNFINDGVITKRAITKESTHVFISNNNIFTKNILNGFSYTFPHNISDPKEDFCRSFDYDSSMLPDDFPVAISVSLVNGDTGLPIGKQGILVTYKLNSNTGYRAFIMQKFYPRNNRGSSLSTNYFRKANTSTNDWSAWHSVEGNVL